MPILRIFHSLLLLSLALSAILWFGPRYIVPSEPELLGLLQANGAGALSYHIAFGIRDYLPFAYAFGAVGMFFFTWWSRPLFVASYVVGFVATGLGGFSVWPAWEAFVIYLATLIDGAIFVFAFTPPLTNHFSKVRLSPKEVN